MDKNKGVCGILFIPNSRIDTQVCLPPCRLILECEHVIRYPMKVEVEGEMYKCNEINWNANNDRTR